MHARSFPLYVCLLGILTSLTPSSHATPEVRQSVRKPASGSVPGQQVTASQPQGDAAPTRTPMTSAELVSQLNQPEAAVKTHILVFQHKTITGDLELGVEQVPVPFRVEFRDCEFQDKVAIQSVVFNESVVFNNVIFDKSFQFENVHVKGDLQLYDFQILHTQDPSQPGKSKPARILLNQARVDGDVRIRNPQADMLEAENLAAGNVIVWLAKSGISELDFAKLDTGRLSIAGAAGTKVGELLLSGSVIHETLAIQNLTFQTVLAANLTVAKRMQFLPQTLIEKRLDLSFSSLANFDWQFPGDDPFRLPENVNIEGATFSTLHVAPSFSRDARSDKERENRWVAKHTDYGLAFLEKATYYESAYSAYEAVLKTQGRADAADHVYFAMRDRRRYTEWKEALTASGRTIAGINYVIGFGHKWLFGYGRSWVYPIVWCVAFVVAGFFVFRNVGLMEQDDDKPASPFSSLWYSVDLFVPVLSLGVASRWRPKPDRRLRVFYAKLLSLAGLVFLSAALGALTGSLK